MASIRHLLTKRPHTAWEHASAVGIKDCISTLRKRIPHPTWATPAHLLSRKMFAPSTGFACYWGFGIATITAAREHLPKMLAKKSHSCQSNTRQDTRLNACKKRAGFLLMGWVGQKRTLLSQVSSQSLWMWGWFLLLSKTNTFPPVKCCWETISKTSGIRNPRESNLKVFLINRWRHFFEAASYSEGIKYRS